MADNTTIEWADKTFNPWIGCQKVTDACKNCYAEKFATTRLSWLSEGKLWGTEANSVRHVTSNNYWKQPLKWNKEAQEKGIRYRVFCASLADIFENRQDLIRTRISLFALIKATPNLDWLILTKRPHNIPFMLPKDWGEGYPNVWLGTSIGSDKDKEMIDALRSVKAVVRFLSIEPMIGPVNYFKNSYRFSILGALGEIHWVILGGESGPNAREVNLVEMDYTASDCKLLGIPVFVKQMGSNAVVKVGEIDYTVKPSDKKGGDQNDFPKFLCKDRQFPKQSVYNDEKYKKDR